MTSKGSEATIDQIRETASKELEAAFPNHKRVVSVRDANPEWLPRTDWKWPPGTIEITMRAGDYAKRQTIGHHETLHYRYIIEEMIQDLWNHQRIERLARFESEES